MNLGTVYFAADRLEDAETALKKVIELNPEAPLIRGFLGNVYLVQLRPKAALAEYNQEGFRPLHLSGRVLALDALGDRAYEQKIFGLVGVRNNVWLRPLHTDPR